ncbi:hypothetical protein [Novosphingobium sp. KN65.2]|uniref:hypothetical protein n=1 Tax=Novosphingobium sp. KN65.2 TaxID=1478134 RepID=UPI0005E3A9AE|nr:hypothetical protein [Novosphingobium sp. KN65.2]CDO38844.1 hypothetical protein SPHV1_780007 [Novosphingobium sp. KN65.2]
MLRSFQVIAGEAHLVAHFYKCESKSVVNGHGCDPNGLFIFPVPEGAKHIWRQSIVAAAIFSRSIKPVCRSGVQI